MRFFLMLLLISLQTQAAEWHQLIVDEKYELTQSFSLPQLERSGSFLDLEAGSKVELKEVIGLDMIRVSLFRFDYLNCPGPAMKTAMEIIAVKDTFPIVEIGAQLQENCKLEIFIENRDLMTSSFFN
jgi:hypothetical protein